MCRPWGDLVKTSVFLFVVLLSVAEPPASRARDVRAIQANGPSGLPTTRVYIQPHGVDEKSVIELRKRLIADGVERVNLFVPSLVIACDVPQSKNLQALVDDPRYSLIPESSIEARVSAGGVGVEDLRFVKACYDRARSLSVGSAPYPGPDGFNDVVHVLPPDIVEKSRVRAALSASPDGVLERNIQQNSEFLVGDVLMRLVFPESAGHAEDWTEQEIADATAGAYAAALAFEAMFGYVPMHFVLTAEKQVPTSVEPILTYMDNHGFWIAETMASLGMASQDPALMVHDYNNQGRNYYGTDWVFTAFIARSVNAPNHRFADQFYTAYAFLGGPCLVIPHPAGENPFGIDPELVFSTVFQHEMFHDFWALDEYTGPNNPSQCDSRTGYLNYNNMNQVKELEGGSLQSCPGIETQPCIMWRAKEDLGRPVCAYTQGQIGVIDANRNSIPDVFDAAPVVEFTDAAVETVDAPEVSVNFRAISKAVPNINPFQGPGTRVDYAAPLMDAVVSVNGVGAIRLAPLDGKWDEAQEDLSISLKGIPVGMTEVGVVARSSFGKSSAKFVKKIYFMGIKFALFDVDPEENAIRVSWNTVGETFGAELDLHRIDASAGGADTTLLAEDVPGTQQPGGVFRHYQFIDTNVTPGTYYTYFVTGRFTIQYASPDTTIDYEVNSEVFGAQSMFPIPAGMLASYVSPNPFSEKTQISVRVPQSSSLSNGSPSRAAAAGGTAVEVRVYDVAGRPVKTIYEGNLYAGVKTFEWDGTDDSNTRVSSGVYFLKTTAGTGTEVKKVVVVR